MQAFSLHPNVYATGQAPGLIRMLEEVWVRDKPPNNSIFYIVSGYANYNGGVRFYEVFRQHVAKGGRIVAVFAGSSSQRLSSKQVVEELLEIGAEVHIINRKRLMHAKCYGTSTAEGDRLIVTSGNFTAPGMGQNIEAAVILNRETARGMGFTWDAMLQHVVQQAWDRHQPSLSDRAAPGWRLLYDEEARDVRLDESEESTMIVTLSHADTARIQAAPGTDAGKGTQYFWLSKDCYDFFPPLTIRNERGHKATFACLINMEYVDINLTVSDCRVTFEAENNLDFRLGTDPLRYRNIASQGDIAAISRISEDRYQLRIHRQGTPIFAALSPFAIHFIGHQGKRYGYIPNDAFERIAGVRLS